MPVNPMVSVVMPAYNAERSIGVALASVQAQTFRDYEIIVVDDGSTDRTVDCVVAAAPEARVLRQPNGGPGRARNTGIAHARGEFVALLDADDIWFPDALAILCGYARRYPEVGVVGALSTQPFRVARGTRAAEPPRNRFCDLFHKVLQIPTSSALMRRTVLVEVGGFDERREIYVEDWDLWLRIAAHHPVGHVPRTIDWYRPGGMMSSDHERTYRGQQLTTQKALPLCAEACARYRDDPGACLARRRHLMHLNYAREMLRAGKLADGRRALAAAVAEQPLALRTRLLHAASLLPRQLLRALYAVKDRVAPPR